MGWFGLHSAILHADPEWIAEELSPRRNPNDPATALEIAARNMTESGRLNFLEWADRWMRDPANDCLRARGDARWNAVCRAERVVRAHTKPPAGSNRVVTGGDAGNEGDFVDSEYSGL